MYFLSKIIHRETFFRYGLDGLALPWKFCRLLFSLYGLLSINILLIGLTSSCSKKTIVTKLKSLQPKEITQADNNITNTNNLTYPLNIQEDIVFDDSYTIETFSILLIVIFFICFLNSEYPGKVLNLFKKKR